MLEILVIGKSPFYLKIISSLIEYYGYKTRSCQNPENLNYFIKEHQIKIVLVNFQEENNELIDFLNRIHHLPISIIIMSHFYDKELETEPFFQFVYAYLIKPKGILYLKEILNKLETNSDRKILPILKKEMHLQTSGSLEKKEVSGFY